LPVRRVANRSLFSVPSGVLLLFKQKIFLQSALLFGFGVVVECKKNNDFFDLNRA
jgi:hypothetical protein